MEYSCFMYDLREECTQRIQTFLTISVEIQSYNDLTYGGPLTLSGKRDKSRVFFLFGHSSFDLKSTTLNVKCMGWKWG